MYPSPQCPTSLPPLPTGSGSRHSTSPTTSARRTGRGTTGTSSGRWTRSWCGRRSRGEGLWRRHQTCITRRSPSDWVAGGRRSMMWPRPRSWRRLRDCACCTWLSTPTTSTGHARSPSLPGRGMLFPNPPPPPSLNPPNPRPPSPPRCPSISPSRTRTRSCSLAASRRSQNWSWPSTRNSARVSRRVRWWS